VYCTNSASRETELHAISIQIIQDQRKCSHGLTWDCWCHYCNFLTSSSTSSSSTLMSKYYSILGSSNNSRALATSVFLDSLMFSFSHMSSSSFSCCLLVRFSNTCSLFPRAILSSHSRSLTTPPSYQINWR
jgi:hypothetical protein